MGRAVGRAGRSGVLHSGHYYYEELRDCPWCGIEKHARVRLFNFLITRSGSRRGHFRLDEIWKEIERIETPDAPLIPWDNLSIAPGPSSDVEEALQSRITRLLFAILFSVISGFGIGFLEGLTNPIILMIPVMVIAWMISGAEQIDLNNLQTIFQSQQPIPDDPLVLKVRSRLLQAEHAAGRLQDQYDLEAGNERWELKRDELWNQIETYQRLAKIRDSKLKPPARKEVDLLRLRLEQELSDGAHYLHSIKQEIETNRQKLQPAMVEARQSLAQAEKDWKVVLVRNSFKPVLLALLIAFFIGLMLNQGGGGSFNAVQYEANVEVDLATFGK